MFKDCRTCKNAIYDPDYDMKKCQCYNHAIKDVDKYIDCVSHTPKESEERVDV